MDLNLKIKKQVPMDLHLLDLYHLERLYLQLEVALSLIDSTAHSQKIIQYINQDLKNTQKKPFFQFFLIN